MSPTPNAPTIMRHKRGTWFVYDNGRHESCGTRDEAEAKRYLELYKTGKTKAPMLLVRDLLLAEVAKGHEMSRIKALLTYCGTRTRVRDINPQWCRDYVPVRRRLRKRDGEVVSDTTIRGELKLVLSVAREAAEELDPSYGIAGWLPKEAYARAEILYADEFDRCVHIALGRVPSAGSPDGWLHDPAHGGYVRDPAKARRWSPVARFLMLGGYTGSRSGVMENARWGRGPDHGHVDLDDDVFYRKGAAQPVSNKGASEVALHPVLRRFLFKCHERDCNDGFDMLPGADGGWIIHGEQGLPCSLPHLWQEVIAAAGFDNVTRHGLRHSCATWLLSAGLPESEVADFLDVTVEILLSTYAHADFAMSGQAAAAIDRAFAARSFAKKVLAALAPEPDYQKSGRPRGGRAAQGKDR